MMDLFRKSLFQRTSSFDEEAYARKEWQEHNASRREVRLDVTGEHNQSRVVSKKPKLIAAKATGPERSDLERWYIVLDEMMSVGSHQSSTELQNTLADVRDDIYAFLH
jgi:hypothetical protein